jgi:hypothetical protein
MSEKAIERITEYYGGHAVVFRPEFKPSDTLQWPS